MEKPKAETLEINELHKASGRRYRVTAQELTGGEYAATIQLRAELKEHPEVLAQISYDLWQISHELAIKAGVEEEHGEDHGVD